MPSKALFRLLITVLAASVLPGHGTPLATATQHRIAHAPVVFEVASGVTVALREADMDTTHLHFEVCGPDVTRIPAGLPVAFGFDTPIRTVVAREADTGMAVDVRIEEHVATVSLTRDPFMPPEPWRVAVLITLESVPENGGIAVGAAETHDISYRMPPGAASSSLGRGRGCVDLLASGWEPPRRA
jgi:hypothetical protein